MKQSLIATALCLCLFSVCQAESRYYNHNADAEEIENRKSQLMAQAESGDAKAQFDVGLAYADGLYINSDPVPVNYFQTTPKRVLLKNCRSFSAGLR